MANVVQFNNDFMKKKTDFDDKNENTKLINEKSDTYDYLLKNKSKNLKKLSKIMEMKDEEIPLMKTPIHLIVLKSITTIETFITKIGNDGFNVKTSHSDKFYLGIVAGFISILLLLFKL